MTDLTPDAFDLLRQHQETGSPPLGDLSPEDWVKMEIEDGDED